MDVLYFLKERTRFIRQHYEAVNGTFVETKRKINDQEPPFDEYPPGFNPEDGEPAYLDEWMDADSGQEFLGQSCVSFISASLKVFLDEMRFDLSRFFRGLPDFNKKLAKDRGFIAANKQWFGELGIEFSASGADLEIVEEFVITRNNAQHPSSITSMNVTLRGKQVKKRPAPWFAHDHERFGIDPDDREAFDRFDWILSITRAKFLQGVDEVDKLCEYIAQKCQRLPAEIRAAHQAGATADET